MRKPIDRTAKMRATPLDLFNLNVQTPASYAHQTYNQSVYLGFLS